MNPDDIKQKAPDRILESVPQSSKDVDNDRIEAIPHLATDAVTPAAGPRELQSPISSEISHISNGLSYSSNYSSGFQVAPRGDYFRSRRINKDKIERPWLEKKDPRAIWVEVFPILGFVLGLAISGIVIWDGVRSVAKHKYCEVYSDNFTSWNSNVWTKEVEVGGFG